jgi:hypothetical protein
MLKPTIYIPSRLTNLLTLLVFPHRVALTPVAGLLGSGAGHRPNSGDRGRAGQRGRGDWQGCSYRWTGSRSLCTG